MTMIDPGTAALRDLCGGAVALPGDDGYDAARQAFNLAVDQRPAAVAYPADAGEVAEVVRAARAAGLRIAPQATGHNAGPLGDLSQTVLLKTSGMSGVAIDAERRIARVGAGVLWEDVVDAAAPHGLAALHGSAPNVGVVGYSLGGGMGWLARSHGLQANSVTAVELVTAEGEFIRADADNDPELFWALRGGGGNFGIVTALEFRLYPLSEIYAGFMLWDWTEAERVLTAWAQWAVDAPDHVTTSFRIMQMPPLEELPELVRGRSLVMIDGAVQGDPAVLDRCARWRPRSTRSRWSPRTPWCACTRTPRSRCRTSAGRRSSRSCPRRRSRRCSSTPAPAPARRSRASSCARSAARCGRRPRATARSPASTRSSSSSPPAWRWTPTWARSCSSHADRVKTALAPWLGAGQYLNFAEDAVDTALTYGEATSARLRAIKDRVDPDGAIHANHAI